MNRRKTLCYFGIYNPTASRDKVYLDGLKKLGVEIIECVDHSAGFLKFFRLIKKHRLLGGRYDILWVGYLSPMLVPIAWFISSKKIVWNALGSWYESAVLDRGEYSSFYPKAWFIWLCDFFSFKMADAILVESESQKKFISRKFFANPAKLYPVFTGVAKDVFHPDSFVKKRNRFSVIFRGIFAPATGVEYVLEAARLLKTEQVDFIIVGWGPLQKKVEKLIKDCELSNVTLITNFLESKYLRELMLSCHIMLGQFSGHPRLERTIQHKTTEALALGLPYITRDSESNRELLSDGINCLFVPPVDSQSLAAAILKLQVNTQLSAQLSMQGLKTFNERLDQEILAQQVFQIISKIL